MRGVEAEVVKFEDCPEDCFRLREWGISGPDHFRTPAGIPRHLFCSPGADPAWLDREYVPHIAAYAYVILQRGYNAMPRSLSRDRTFSRDLASRSHGQSYETDAEFYDESGDVFLQIEAEASLTQTNALAAAIRSHRDLSELPGKLANEIEYVFDIQPQCLWVVGPGSIDPPAHVSRVSVEGLNATFTASRGRPPAGRRAPLPRATAHPPCHGCPRVAEATSGFSSRCQPSRSPRTCSATR
jgi:hypothetical protein